MENKSMRVGEIYGLWDNEGGYHSYLIIAITQKRTYFLQGSSIKLKPIKYYPYFEDTNIFEEQGLDFYVLRDYNFDQSLQYKTTFSVERFNFSKEKEEQVKKQKLIGIVSKNDYENIRELLLEIDWQNTAYISDKHFKEDILQQATYMEEWN